MVMGRMLVEVLVLDILDHLNQDSKLVKMKWKEVNKYLEELLV